MEGISKAKYLVFRVRLLSGRGIDFSQQGILREIAISPSDTLYRLAIAILRSVGFSDIHHLFMFCNKMPFGYDPVRRCYEIAYDDWTYPDMRKVTVAEAISKMGYNLILWFDYCDDWLFRVKLLKKPPKLPEGTTLPAVLRSEGEAPEQYPFNDLEEE